MGILSYFPLMGNDFPLMEIELPLKGNQFPLMGNDSYFPLIGNQIDFPSMGNHIPVHPLSTLLLGRVWIFWSLHAVCNIYNSVDILHFCLQNCKVTIQS